MNHTITTLGFALGICLLLGSATTPIPPAEQRVEPGNPLIDSNAMHRQGIKSAARELADVANKNLGQLEEALRYNNETVQWAAQDALVSLGEYAVPVLTNVLQTEDGRAKEHACNALQRIGPAASSAIPLLLESLRADASTANYAARALSTVGKGSTLARDGLREALTAGEVRSAGAVEATLRTIEESLKKTPEQSAGGDAEERAPQPQRSSSTTGTGRERSSCPTSSG